MQQKLLWFIGLVTLAFVLPYLGLAALGASGFAQFDGTCVNMTAELYNCTLREFAENQLFFAVFFGIVPASMLAVVCATATAIGYGAAILIIDLVRKQGVRRADISPG